MNDRYEENIKYFDEIADNPYLVVLTLGILCRFPIDDQRMLPFLEEMCNDTRITVEAIPPTYCEVRYMAAHALREHRAVLGIDEHTILRSILKPMNNQQIFVACKNALGWEPWEKGLRPLEAYQMLAEMGKVPIYDLKLPSRLSK